MITRFEPTKRDMLPLYEFQWRMAVIKCENLFSQTRELTERLQKLNDELTFDNLASEELNRGD